jgi:hypothetical protein
VMGGQMPFRFKKSRDEIKNRFSDPWNLLSLFVLVVFGLLSRWWWMRWAAAAVLVADAGATIYFWYRNLPPPRLEKGALDE